MSARQDRYYQHDAIAAVLADYDAGYRSLLLALATGAGKTHTSVKLARAFCEKQGIADPRIAFVAPRIELVDQTIREIGVTWPEVTAGKIQGANSQFGRNWSVAVVNSAYSPKRLKRMKAQDYNVLIMDECFPAGTLVDGVPIESLKQGDMVTAFDEATGQFSRRAVAAIMARPCDRLVEIEADGNKIICTPNHPFWTLQGWRRAGELAIGQKVLRHEDCKAPVRGLWQLDADGDCSAGTEVLDLQGATGGSQVHSVRSLGAVFGRQWQGDVAQGPDVLLKRLQGHLRSAGIVGEDARHEPSTQRLAAGENESCQSDGQRGSGQEDERQPQAHWTSTQNAGWQRNRTNQGPGVACDGIGGVGDGIRGSHASGTEGLPEPLQDRHCQSTASDCSRGGRLFPLLKDEAGPRRQEGRISHWVGVDRVQVLERGSLEFFAAMRGQSVVYNIEVEDFHTYVAGGFVVHNCHHATSAMNREVIDTLAGPDTLILGLTATPNRSDGIALSEVFERISYTYLLPDAISDGFLVDLQGVAVHLPIDLDSLPKGDDGDFRPTSLRKTMMAPEVVSATVQAWLDHAKGLRTVAFGVEIEHATTLAQAFRSAGVAADVVHGGMPALERNKRYKALNEGAITVLCNVAVLTEGFDEPSVECVLLARPTTSQGLYTQIVGRGARLYPGKTRCLVVDVTGTCSKLSLQSLPMLGGLPLPQLDAEERDEAEREGALRTEGNVEFYPSLLAATHAARCVDLLRGPKGQRYQWGDTQWGPALSVGRAGLFMVLVDHEHPGRYRIAHAQEARGVPAAVPTLESAYRVEILATNLPSAEAIGLVEAEARRFGARGKEKAGEPIGTPPPGLVEGVLADVRARHRHLEGEAGKRLAKGAAAGCGPALLRRLRARMTEPQARAMTQHEAMEVLKGGDVPARVLGAV